MRTSLEFRAAESSDPFAMAHAWRDTLARLLADELPKHGFDVIETFAEDWGWHVTLANDGFPLWMGCGHYDLRWTGEERAWGLTVDGVRVAIAPP